MAEFILNYQTPQSAMEKMHSMKPEDMQKAMGSWMKWAESCGEHLLDMGSMLSNGQRVDLSGSTPSKTEVGGYSILQADDMEKAKELVKDHPHLEFGDGCYIEIYEKMTPPKC